MRLNLLYEFVILSKYLNYSKAAEHLYLTQPVLSRHISELESRVGAQLLVRNTRNVQLTEMGRIFAEGSRQ
jgi:DNA-binding transcriptional LysR family regulator